VHISLSLTECASEPILCSGSTEFTIWEDGWTVCMNDGKRTVQFEHTCVGDEHVSCRHDTFLTQASVTLCRIAITENGHRVLTALQENNDQVHRKEMGIKVG
jgi:hypothetical protein